MRRYLTHFLACLVGILFVCCASTEKRVDDASMGLEQPPQVDFLSVTPVALNDVESDLGDTNQLTGLLARAMTRTSGVTVALKSVVGAPAEECATGPCVIKNLDVFVQAGVHVRASVALLGESYHCSIVIREGATILNRNHVTHSNMEHALQIAGWEAGKALRKHFGS